MSWRANAQNGRFVPPKSRHGKESAFPGESRVVGVIEREAAGLRGARPAPRMPGRSEPVVGGTRVSGGISDRVLAMRAASCLLVGCYGRS
jgi:hypothetical protein